jgi:hypothetical protein
MSSFPLPARLVGVALAFGPAIVSCSPRTNSAQVTAASRDVQAITSVDATSSIAAPGPGAAGPSKMSPVAAASSSITDGAALSDPSTNADPFVRFRLALATDVRSVFVMRLDNNLPEKERPPSGLIRTFRIRAGRQTALTDTERAAFVTLLREPSIVDAHELMRCPTRHWVGFAIEHVAVISVNARTLRSELVLDFECNRAFVLASDDEKQTVHVGTFRDSRASVLGLVKRILPNDREIQQLK